MSHRSTVELTYDGQRSSGGQGSVNTKCKAIIILGNVQQNESFCTTTTSRIQMENKNISPQVWKAIVDRIAPAKVAGCIYSFFRDGAMVTDSMEDIRWEWG